MYVYTYIYICVYMYIYMCVLRRPIFIENAYLLKSRLRTRVCAYTHVRVCVNTHAYGAFQLHVNLRVYTVNRADVLTHTCTHKCTHKHKLSLTHTG